MGEVDTFGLYVRRRLDHWGRVFALSRDCEYLGHQSKNMLQVLIEHKGEMPGRVIGFKPLEVDQDALQVEMIVADIAREDLAMACVLRAYHCASGRRKIERWETANLLITYTEAGPMMRQKKYLETAALGEAIVRNKIIGFRMAA